MDVEKKIILLIDYLMELKELDNEYKRIEKVCNEIERELFIRNTEEIKEDKNEVFSLTDGSSVISDDVLNRITEEVNEKLKEKESRMVVHN